MSCCAQDHNGASHQHIHAPTPDGKRITTTELRAIQAPLKSNYKKDPTAALVTLTSTGTLSNTSISCKLSSGSAIKSAKSRVAGLHPLAGGSEASISGDLCSGDMLLEARVACAGVTLKAVATALALPLIDGEVFAEVGSRFQRHAWCG